MLKNRYGSEWSRIATLKSLVTIMIMYIRGVYYRVFFGTVKGIFLIGKGTTIRYMNGIKAGKSLLIEDFAEINALSRQGIQIGNNVSIGRFSMIKPTNLYGGEVGEGLLIGNNSNVGPYCYIGCSGFIEIGNNVMMSPRVSLYAENHVFSNPEIPMKEQGVKKEFIKIEDDCWLAANCVVLAGVTIGKGSIIAAGSIVSKNVPPYSIVAGVPAKVIGSR